MSLAGRTWCLIFCAAACSGGTGLPDGPLPDAPPPTSQFMVSWTLVANAQTVTCAQVGALVVAVEVTSPTAGSGFVEAFTCANGMGTSRTVKPGTYDLAFELLGDAGSLGTLPTQRLMLRAKEVAVATPLQFPVQLP